MCLCRLATPRTVVFVIFFNYCLQSILCTHSHLNLLVYSFRNPLTQTHTNIWIQFVPFVQFVYYKRASHSTQTLQPTRDQCTTQCSIHFQSILLLLERETVLPAPARYRPANVNANPKCNHRYLMVAFRGFVPSPGQPRTRWVGAPDCQPMPK